MDGVVSIGTAISNEAAVLVDNRFTIGPGTASSPDQVSLNDLKQKICRVPHGVARVALTSRRHPISWGGVERSRCPLRQQVGHPLFFIVTLESAVE